MIFSTRFLNVTHEFCFLLQVVRYDIYLNLQRRDRRFAYDPQISQIIFPYETIQNDELMWTPTVYFPDGINAQIPDVMKPNIQVHIYLVQSSANLFT